MRFGGPRSLDKEPNSAVFERIGFVADIRRGHGERRDWINLLPFSPQRLPAGGDDPRRWTCAQQRLGHFGRGVNQVFAIVEQEQQLFSVHRARNAPGCDGTSGEFDPDRGGNCSGDKVGVGE
jgi:hypothetical protein